MALLLSSLALATFDFLSHPNRSGLYKRQLFDIGEDKEKESSLIWGQKGATTSKSSSYDSRISAPLLLHSYLKSIGHTWPHYRSSKESRPSPSNKSFRDEIKHGNRRIRLRRGAGLLFFCFRRNVIGRISRWCVRRSAVSEWPALSPATGHGGAPHHGRVSSATLPLAACSLFLCFMSFYLFVCVSVCECVWVCVCVCGRFAPLLVYCFSFSSSIFFPISLMSFVRPIPDGISWLKTTLPVVVVVGLYHDGRQIFPDEVERNYDGARSSRRKRKKTSKRNTKTKTKHHHGKCKQRRQMTKKNNMPEADSGAFFIFVSRFHRFISSWQKKTNCWELVLLIMTEWVWRIRSIRSYFPRLCVCISFLIYRSGCYWVLLEFYWVLARTLLGLWWALAVLNRIGSWCRGACELWRRISCVRQGRRRRLMDDVAVTLCFTAPRSAQWLRNGVNQLSTTLSPRKKNTPGKRK